MKRALDTFEMISSTWYLKFSWGSKKTPKNLIAGILERELICSRLLWDSCVRGSRLRNTTGRAAGEEREQALLRTGKVAPRETSERCVRTRSRREDPQEAWSGASGSGRGAHRGSLEAGGDATGVDMSEMQAAQRRGKPTRRFHGTPRSH
jgi:hypothetical protein